MKISLNAILNISRKIENNCKPRRFNKIPLHIYVYPHFRAPYIQFCLLELCIQNSSPSNLLLCFTQGNKDNLSVPPEGKHKTHSADTDKYKIYL